MMFFLKMIAVSSLLVSSFAMSQTLPVKVSLFESTTLSEITIETGYNRGVAIVAVAADGSIIEPSLEDGSFIFPAPGLYTFRGQSDGFCGMNNAEVQINENIAALRFFGWCE